MGDDASFADDIEVAQTAGLKIAFTQGDVNNFKVTYPEDFAKAETMLTPNNNTETYTATGTGFDVHRFTDGDVHPMKSAREILILMDPLILTNLQEFKIPRR